jgi:hypothetical protein
MMVQLWGVRVEWRGGNGLSPCGGNSGSGLLPGKVGLDQ